MLYHDVTVKFICKERKNQNVKENPEKYKEIVTIGEFITVGQPVVTNAEVLVMELYKKEPSMTLNLLGYHLFCRKQAGGESLPPTYDAFYQHLLGANCKSFIWRPLIPQPISNGWHKENDQLLPTLMTKPPVPDTLLELIVCNCKKGCKRNCKCDLACTEACQCEGGDDCENPNTFESEETLY